MVWQGGHGPNNGHKEASPVGVGGNVCWCNCATQQANMGGSSSGSTPHRPPRTMEPPFPPPPPPPIFGRERKKKRRKECRKSAPFDVFLEPPLQAKATGCPDKTSCGTVLALWLTHLLPCPIIVVKIPVSALQWRPSMSRSQLVTFYPLLLS